MTQLAFDFSAPVPVRVDSEANDYHKVPASARQLRYARQIAARARISVPDAALMDRRTLSSWIDDHRSVVPSQGRFSDYPSSKQVAFAERLARLKRRDVPRECFKDKRLMSRWIDSNR